ncbi:MAG: xylose isomerase, partial [Candidatus Hydrogenedentota bacterium]
MSEPYFKDIESIPYEGPDSSNPLAYRYYDANRVLMGKTMAEHLRPAVCYWHTFCWGGQDMFGADVFDRPWFTGDSPLAMAEHKMEVAFEFFTKLGIPFYCFHDRDAAPEGDTLAESNANLDAIADKMLGKINETGVKLLWGTANLFSHPRYMGGAATNPNPEVFAYAAAQVKHALEVTHRLGGVNYVLWGGREGYETLLNTDMKKEVDQLGRFLNMVVEHKHKIGFTGSLLIEPKPHEPTKHQYDHDAATVHAFLQKYDLMGEFFVNLETNHATLAGHSFQHEIAYSMDNGIFGSVDMNRGDMLLGWDTDQFQNNVEEVTLGLYTLLQGGGLTNGGFNFDAKIRRQSNDPADLFHAHVGGIDTLARGLINAVAMIENGGLKSFVDERYADWSGILGKDILSGSATLESMSEKVLNENL